MHYIFRIFLFYFLGAFFGPLLDALHTHNGVLAYHQHEILLGRMAWWVPFLHGVVVMSVAIAQPIADRMMKTTAQRDSWLEITSAFFGFVLMYICSAIGSNTRFLNNQALSALLLFMYLMNFLISEGRIRILAYTAVLGLLGLGFESTLCYYKVFRYIRPDFLGLVRHWIVWLWMGGGLALHMLARRLAFNELTQAELFTLDPRLAEAEWGDDDDDYAARPPFVRLSDSEDDDHDDEREAMISDDEHPIQTKKHDKKQAARRRRRADGLFGSIHSIHSIHPIGPLLLLHLS
eukprot:TRINITY_DN1388_c0_g1_i10.p1 TRINITY_DN1388_c0_g1~~TRINITY_DN1388_c0_g1_i10.p1  ORF type:complete len:291 (-),score=69.45 TRINITY_DN1388_c0_g1_i10:1878-2750(-)